MALFRRSHAILIGIDAYGNGIPSLASATNDARRLAEILLNKHGYRPHLLLDHEASLSGLRRLVSSVLPAEVGPEDRLLFYFAGHGLALDDDTGPAGYLVPQDASRDDERSLLPIADLNDALCALPCRHALLILDCCFAGAFRWSTSRDMRLANHTLYQERFDRFVMDPAWQVLTSAAHDQTALDTMAGFGTRGSDSDHSPFAIALFDALRGEADLRAGSGAAPPTGDGVITATELYVYIRDRLEPVTQAAARRQTPGLWTLRRHDKGEYVFFVPDRASISLPLAHGLSPLNNPYRGLEPYDEADHQLFFGRDKQVELLLGYFHRHPLIIVTGPSGTGKSSLVRAGLIPHLRACALPQWHVLGPIRPGKDPLRAVGSLLMRTIQPGTEPIRELPLASRVDAWITNNAEDGLVLVIDQLEELLTLSGNEARDGLLTQLAEALERHPDRFRLVVTVRADFEPQFAAGTLRAQWLSERRYVVPPLTQDELRDVICEPAAARVLYFEPSALVDRMINEVIQMPGALPLLSFALSELYLRYVARGSEDRLLRESDYDALGGVAGALRARANAEYDGLDELHQATMRRVLLRMVALEGGQLARRPVLMTELVYADEHENQRVGEVNDRLLAARLVVAGQTDDGQDFLEPAHNALVQGWDRLWKWVKREQEALVLQRRLDSAAMDWERGGRRKGQLWNDDPRLRQAEAARTAPSSWLNRIEAEFTAASMRRSIVQRQVQMALVVLALAFGVTSGIAAVVAKRQTQLALSQGVAARAEAAADRAPGRAILLALEALAIARRAGQYRMPAAEETLRHTLTSFSGLRLGDHNGPVNSLALSRDGRWLMTGAADGTALLWNLGASDPAHAVRTLAAHGGPVTGVTISADGQWLATSSLDKNARVWSRDRIGDTPLHLEHPSGLTGLLFTPDGGRLVTGTEQGQVFVWDLTDSGRAGQSIVLPGDQGPISLLTVSPNGHWLLTADRVGTARLWDLDSPDPAASAFYLQSQVMAASMSATAPLLATGTVDGTVVLYRLDAPDPSTASESLRGPQGAVKTVAISLDGHWLAAGGDDGGVYVWDLTSQAPAGALRVLRGHSDAVRALAFDAAGNWLVSGSEDATARTWDLSEASTSLAARVLRGHDDFVLHVAVSPDGRRVVTGSTDHTARLWDLLAPDGAAGTDAVLRGLGGSVVGVAFGSSGDDIVVAGGDGRLTVWDLARSVPAMGTEAGVRPGRSFTALATCPHLERIATANADHTVRIWGVTVPGHPQLNQVLKGHVGRVNAVALTSDCRTVVTGSDDYTVRVWDIMAQHNLGSSRILRGHLGAVTSVAVSRMSPWLATAGDDRVIRLWNLEAGDPAANPIELEGHEGRVTTLRMSGDGQLLLSGSDDQTARVWDIGTTIGRSRTVRELRGHVGRITAADISRDGHWAITGSTDRSARLWDLTSGDQAAGSIALLPHNDEVTAVGISPDSHWAVAASRDADVRVYDLTDDDPARSAVSLRADAGAINALAFSPDSRWVAVAGADGTTRRWLLDLD